MKLVAKIDKNFRPYEYWGNNNPLPAANFWAPGTWTYTNAAYFGANPEWLNSEGKLLHAQALQEAGVAEESNHEYNIINESTYCILGK